MNISHGPILSGALQICKNPSTAASMNFSGDTGNGAYGDIDDFELEREYIEVKRAVGLVKGDVDVIVSDIALLIDKDKT